MKTRSALLVLLLGVVLVAQAWPDRLPAMPEPQLSLPAASVEPIPEHPTFNHDVGPLVFQHCTECHRPGQIGPFALTSYAEVRRHAQKIAEVTASREMPPWKPAPGWGTFRDDRHLSDAQIETLQRWVTDGTPEGDPGERPVPPQFSDSWMLGTPDIVVASHAFTIPADGPDLYRCFVVPLPASHDLMVSAVEVQTDNRRVVHHLLLFLDTSGEGRRRASRGVGGSYASFGGPGFVPSGTLGGWAPGSVPEALPEGVARRVPAGADLIMQVHFHPTGKVETATCQVGLHLAQTPVTTEVIGMVVGTPLIDLPAGDPNCIVRDRFKLPVDVTVYGVAPHAHLLCRSIEAVASLPDGRVLPLINIPDWDFNWQGQYPYREPLQLPAGTQIDVQFRYDNSAGNKRNPNQPPREVHFGEQTTDEMGLLFLGVSVSPPGDAAVLRSAVRRHFVGGFLHMLADPSQWGRLRHWYERRRAAQEE